MMLRKALLIAITALVAVTAFGQGTQLGGALPPPLPLLPSSNWWNTDISRAPVDSNSLAFINFIGTARQAHPDFGGDADVPPEIYGMPYIVVAGNTPLEQVTFTLYGDQSDAGAPGRPTGYPIPVEAKSNPKWIEGGYPGGGSSGDRHMLIVDRDNRFLFELWATSWNASLNRWEAGSGAVFPLDSNARRPAGWTSADAAGLAILPGLVRYDEAFGTAPIRHSFRVTVRATNGQVFPASHEAGDTIGALPMGARLRLKASKDISGYTPEVQRIFQAMKSYGLIVADNGSDLYISGTNDSRWNNDVLNPAFHSLHGSDFEVVQLGWRPEVKGDLNNDRRADLIWRNSATGANAFWLLDGSAVVGGGLLDPVSDTAWKLGGTGDFNGDGRTDLVWRHSSGVNTVWYMNQGSVQSQQYLPSLPDNSWQLGGTGDLDGDDHADLVWRNGTTGANAVWFMNGAQTKGGGAIATVADLQWRMIGAGDFDDDGKADLFWWNASTGSLVCWKMDGVSSTTKFIGGVADLQWRAAAVGDANGDGYADVFWKNSSGGVAVWFLRGETVIGGGFIGAVSDSNWDLAGAR